MKPRIDIFLPPLEGGELKVSGQPADFIRTNAAGEVATDSKAERIKAHHDFVAQLAPKLAKSPLLARLVRFYAAAVSHPADELVHLYDVRDALRIHFRREASARKALGVTKAEWQHLGDLADHAPLNEGRHRGRHAQGTRPATREELETAREAAKLLIIRFAKTVP